MCCFWKIINVLDVLEFQCWATSYFPNVGYFPVAACPICIYPLTIKTQMCKNIRNRFFKIFTFKGYWHNVI